MEPLSLRRLRCLRDLGGVADARSSHRRENLGRLRFILPWLVVRPPIPLGLHRAEAVATAKAARMNAPIRLMWTREGRHQGWLLSTPVRASHRRWFDAQGKPAAWLQRIVGQSILAARRLGMIKDGIDFTSVEGRLSPPF